MNGKKIGHIGSFPYEPEGYISKWPAVREYHLSVNDKTIKWDADNIIAVRVYDGGGSGGIFMGQPYLDALEKINGVKIDYKIQYISPAKADVAINIENHFNTTVEGILNFKILNAEKNQLIESKQSVLVLKPFGDSKLKVSLPDKQGIIFKISFKEKSSGYENNISETLPYILTPPVSLSPRINGADVLGAQV